MGFSNGYDSGYSDAIDDVKAGRVQGLGPVAEGGSEESSGGSTHGGHGAAGPSLGSGGNAIQAIQNDHSFRVAMVSNGLSTGKKLNVLDVRGETGTTYNFYQDGTSIDEFLDVQSGVRDNCTLLYDEYTNESYLQVGSRDDMRLYPSQDDPDNTFITSLTDGGMDMFVVKTVEDVGDGDYLVVLTGPGGDDVNTTGHYESESFYLGEFAYQNHQWYGYQGSAVPSPDDVAELYWMEEIIYTAVKTTAVFTEPASVAVPSAGSGDILVWMHCPTGYGTTVSPVSFTGATLNDSMPSAAGDYLVVLEDSGTSYDVSVEDRSETT